MRALRPTALFTIAIAAFSLSACSTSAGGSGFDERADAGAGANDGGSGPGFGSDGGAGGCVGLACKKVSCPGGATTTISGRVFDPAGKNPLYDVAVYVPSVLPLPALPSGVTCDRCGATAVGAASSALTDENGRFTLTDVPVDHAVPLVIQVGKWRRTFTLDVNACADNPMPTPLTLPKNGTEGDMPQFAVAANILDSLECLLVGMGVDASEFVTGASIAGHVHVFSAADNESLWASEATLHPYDVVLLDCEGGESPSDKSAAMLKGMHDYAGEGGRIFATHYHYLWFKGTSPGVFPSIAGLPDFVDTATWKLGVASWAMGTNSFSVDQSFPKGAAFATWLVNVGASSTKGSIQLNDYADSVDAVSAPGTTRWIYDSSNVEYLSFNTPTTAAAADQCGRVVFSDLHVSGLGVSKIADCHFDSGGNLTAQQKALEFLLLDLSSCVAVRRRAAERAAVSAARARLAFGFAAFVAAAMACACGSSNDGASAGSPGAAIDAGSEIRLDSGSEREASDGGAPPRDAGDVSACGNRTDRRGLTTRTLDVGGTKRTLLAYVPASIDPKARLPLVFVFHGYLMSGQQMHDVTGYADLADREGVAVLFPDGEGGPDSILPPWNVENPGQTVCGSGQFEEASGDDFAFMDAMKADLAQDQCLDDAHVFATGFSMGGYLSHHVGCYRSDVRAVAPHSGGTIADLGTCTTGPVPIVIFHGTSDPTIASGCDDPNGAAQLGFPASATLWAKKNGCKDTTTTVPANGTAGNGTCYLFDGCPANGQVELCTFDGMAHCWAGGSTAGQGSASACPGYASATEIEWAFFKKYAW